MDKGAKYKFIIRVVFLNVKVGMYFINICGFIIFFETAFSPK